MQKLATYILIFFGLTFLGCSAEKAADGTIENNWVKTDLSYATGFSIYKDGALTLIEIPEPYMGAEAGFKYILYPRDQSQPDIKADAYIPVPIESIVCTSTTHIPLLDYLGVSEALIGFPTLDYISSSKVRNLIDDGKVADIGVDANINEELLVSLDPDMMMGYTMSSDMEQFERLSTAGIDIVLNSEYLEQHPLGRAEWIKFMAYFFGMENRADSIFQEIQGRYNETKNLASSSVRRPTAFSGIMYGDTWFLPGGQNYAAKIMRDANIKYIWEEDSTSGFLQLSLESVYEKAASADYWLGVGSFETLAKLTLENNRYSQFDAFNAQEVYSFNKRMGPKGGIEYLELGYLRPDLILEDLTKICHPELFDDTETFFFFRLPIQ